MCIGKVKSNSNILLESDLRTKNVRVKDNFIENDKIEYKEDILSVLTQHTKTVFIGVGYVNKRIYESTFFKILTQTTQPAHLITAIAVISLGFLLTENKPENEKLTASPLLALVYLASFSAHFGAQIWMTFVSGLSLYFSLPRHTFGNVQKVLFPKYFLLNSILSLITLIIFIRDKKYDLRVTEILIQTIGMSTCFFAELVIRLYLTPPLLSLITQKNQIEKDAGVGLEVGKFNYGKLTNCPHYMKIHKRFRKIHMSIAIGNIITMACTMLHLYYLASKIALI